jgi:hypothetical protein
MNRSRPSICGTPAPANRVTSLVPWVGDRSILPEPAQRQRNPPRGQKGFFPQVYGETEDA